MSALNPMREEDPLGAPSPTGAPGPGGPASTVSVIIPSYNYAHYLPECVESALAESTPQLRVEVLVIDDCSSDDTAVVGARLAGSDDRVEFRRHEKNRGHLATYDEGLAWATGDYCIVLSADDLLVPGALRRAARVLDAHPTVGFAYGRSLRFETDDDRPVARTGEPSVRIWAGRDWIAQRCRTATNCISSPEVVVRTSLQHRVGGYRIDLPHSGDLEMWLRLAAHADVAYLEGVDQAYYRMHPASMARTRFATPIADLRQRKAAFDAMFDDHGRFVSDSARLRDRADRALAREALWSACRGMDRKEMDTEAVTELEVFALEVSSHARRLAAYRGLRWRRAVQRRIGAGILAWLPPAYVTTALHKMENRRWWRRWNAHGV